MSQTQQAPSNEEVAKPKPWFAFYMIRKGDDPIVELPTRYLCTTCAIPKQKILLTATGQVKTSTGWQQLPQHLWNREHVHCTGCGGPIKARTRVFGGEEISIEPEALDTL